MICSATALMTGYAPVFSLSVSHASTAAKVAPQKSSTSDPLRAVQVALKDKPTAEVFIDRMESYLRAEEVSFLRARAAEIKGQKMPDLQSLGSGRFLMRDGSRSLSFRVVDASKGLFELNAKPLRLDRSQSMETRWQLLMGAMPSQVSGQNQRSAPWQRWFDLQTPKAQAVLPLLGWIAFSIVGGAVGAAVATEHTCKEIHEYRGQFERRTRLVNDHIRMFPRARAANASSTENRCPLPRALLDQELGDQTLAALQGDIIETVRNFDALVRSLFGQAITEGTIHAGHCAERLSETRDALQRLIRASRQVCLDPTNPEAQTPDGTTPSSTPRPVATPAARSRNAR